MTGSSFNCDGCGACCRLVPDVLLEAYNLPKSERGGCGYLVDNKCSIYESRPDVCSVRTMWEKNHRAIMSWDDYCAMTEKICDTFKVMVEDLDRGN
jgi:Fe-S-cluster containining protein